LARQECITLSLLKRNIYTFWSPCWCHRDLSGILLARNTGGEYHYDWTLARAESLGLGKQSGNAAISMLSKETDLALRWIPFTTIPGSVQISCGRKCILLILRS